MTLELPIFVQCEGQWLALSGSGEVVSLGCTSFEDILIESLTK
ncbi:hypothetical protein [Desulfoscipio gibsoniae]|uniref:DUF5678 domain-containing protein n=1 Tax=Desulfoscipio gibsoniae DSM 7213 TaxID=767817 RepID=R4KLN4_9FIRM|nr:hypothetical protein [Desulfoscipio gibsoniae]AGL00531.1 hypothetical protein Desgi_0991 [Desulfoscipio gibsoniae DSM 7213]